MIIENKRKAYKTDLTDSQWKIIETIMWKSGDKSKWKKEVINKCSAVSCRHWLQMETAAT